MGKTEICDIYNAITRTQEPPGGVYGHNKKQVWIVLYWILWLETR